MQKIIMSFLVGMLALGAEASSDDATLDASAWGRVVQDRRDVAAAAEAAWRDQEVAAAVEAAWEHQEFAAAAEAAREHRWKESADLGRAEEESLRTFEAERRAREAAAVAAAAPAAAVSPAAAAAAPQFIFVPNWEAFEQSAWWQNRRTNLSRFASMRLSPTGVYYDGQNSIITFFGTPHRFQEKQLNYFACLSNYHSAKFPEFNHPFQDSRQLDTIVFLNGQLFSSVEGAYQYGKALLAGHTVDAASFAQKNPDEARNFNKGKKLDKSVFTWLDRLMLGLLWQKFTNNPALGDILKQLKGVTLVEGNTHGDNRWGVIYPPTGGEFISDLDGENKLGTMLTYLADMLATYNPQPGVTGVWIEGGQVFYR